MKRRPRSPLEQKLRDRFVWLGLLVFSIVTLLILSFLNISQRQLIHSAQEDRIDRIIANGGFYPEDDPFTNDPEAAYRARYFSVFYLGPDAPLIIRTRRVVALEEADIIRLAETVLLNGYTDGQIEGYRFKHAAYGHGHLLVFLDTRQDTMAIEQMLSLSFFIFGVLFLVIAILLYLFSSRAIRPFVASVDKQQRFITDASHELKTPLAALRANLDVLEMLHGADEWSQSSHAQIDRLSNRLDQLLTLSRIDESTIPSPHSEINLTEWATEQLKPFRPIFDERNIKVTLDAPTEPVMWTGSVDSLTQIASALLDNATRYTPTGTWFNLAIIPDSAKPQIHFKNPSDLTAKDTKHIFERFYRADYAHQRTDKGSGIGLSIVQALSEREGYSIEAVTKEEGIINFSLTLR